MMKFSVVLTWMLCTAVGYARSSTPEQMHIALAGLTGARIMWFTTNSTGTSLCKFGQNTQSMSAESVGTEKTYLEDYGSHHTVHLEQLSQDATYFYSCGDGATMSDIFSFRTAPSTAATKPISVAVFGDMGWLDSVQRPMGIMGSLAMSGNWSATYSKELLEKLKDNNEIDMIFHVGDVGYADDATFHTMKTFVTFEYEGAYNGYMEWIEDITATVPYHVSPGNHESECHDPACVVNPKKLGKPLSNFTAFNNRWAMPSPESGGLLNMWYSWDYGAVHFVSINSETDFPDAPENEKGDSGIFDAGKFAPDGAYLAWLEADLKAAAESPEVTWIVAGGHRPFKSYSEENQQTLNDMFEKYGVTVYFAGHSHSYSRFLAAEHGGVTTEIVVGGAGCEEMLFSEENPTPGMHVGTTCEDWSNRVSPRDGKKHNKYTACATADFFTDAYAIGKLTVEDNGRGDMKWELLSSMDGSVLDSVSWAKEEASNKK